MLEETSSPVQLPKPPEMFNVTTGGKEEEHIESAADAFFKLVKDAISKYGGKDFSSDRSHVGLYRARHTDGKELVWPTDDNIRILTVNGIIIASVLDRRDDFNYHQVLSASILTSELVAKIAEEPQAITKNVKTVENFEEATIATREFFDEVLDELGYTKPARDVFTQSTTFALYPFAQFGKETQVDVTSDMKITLLTTNDIAIGSVIEQRIGGKWQLTPASFLSPRIIQILRKNQNLFESAS